MKKVVAILNASSLQSAKVSDFLNRFAKTSAISSYSPWASTISDSCNAMFPAKKAGDLVNAVDVIAGAKKLGMQVRFNAKNSDAQISISAEEFNSAEAFPAASVDAICLHGLAPYNYALDKGSQPFKVPCCPRCTKGVELPSAAEVRRAQAYLSQNHPIAQKTHRFNASPARKVVAQIISPGAMILAAQALGFKVTANLDGKYAITRCQGISAQVGAISNKKVV